MQAVRTLAAARDHGQGKALLGLRMLGKVQGVAQDLIGGGTRSATNSTKSVQNATAITTMNPPNPNTPTATICPNTPTAMTNLNPSQGRILGEPGRAVAMDGPLGPGLLAVDGPACRGVVALDGPARLGAVGVHGRASPGRAVGK
mmetsp:Transcript_36908/g.60526  ORF Transcript_36908/g.60526 Transcript_36908/m.60526 type:complete len:145 (-) Transcript_36908:690-1124(-)